MKKALSMSVMAIALAGCISVPPTEQGTPISLSAAQIQAVQNGVRTFLKDPESATFSGSTYAAKTPSGDIFACGLVNAKNSFGGYTGAGPYIAKLSNNVVVDVATSSDEEDSSITIGMCRSHGVPI